MLPIPARKTSCKPGMEGCYSIRRARLSLAEAEALLAVEHHSLGDSSYTPQEILAVMQRPEHYAYVAALGKELVGFCSCFETPAVLGSRLELDMLGVVPAHRQRGVATALLKQAVADGRARGVRVFRGLVAVGNMASQRAFRNAGLSASVPAVDMFVHELRPDEATPSSPPAGWTWHPAGDCRSGVGVQMADRGASAWPQGACWLGREGIAVAGAECLSVCTMVYRGLWLERLWAVSDEAWGLIARLLAARAREMRLNMVSYLAPRLFAESSHSRQGALLEAQGYRALGRYYRFTGGC